MGSGKSTIAKDAAEDIGWNYIDLDTYIESKVGRKISDIFSEVGESVFRRLETEALEEVSQIPNCFISLGGGTPVSGNNMHKILCTGLSVYLHVSNDVLTQRLWHQKDHRPLISGCTSTQELSDFIADMIEKRSPIYKLADIIIDNNSRKGNATEEIISYLGHL